MKMLSDKKLMAICKKEWRKSTRKERRELKIKNIAALAGIEPDAGKFESNYDACERLWRECVFLRAGYKSEASGLPGRQIDASGKVLHPHHIYGKKNHALRFGLENGFCLTEHEHLRGIHGTPAEHEKYRRIITEKRGPDIYDKLAILQNITRVDLSLLRAYLENEHLKLQINFKEGKK